MSQTFFLMILFKFFFGNAFVALYQTNTYFMSSTFQGLQILDPFTDMYTYTDLCLAHLLDSQFYKHIMH